MGELQQLYYLPPPPLPTPTAPPPPPPPAPAPASLGEPPPRSSSQEEPAAPLPRFDPSRMIGTIRRKALIKDLAAIYHAECLTYSQELLELQRKLEEEAIVWSYTDLKIPENPKKETRRPPKRLKKSR